MQGLNGLNGQSNGMNLGNLQNQGEDDGSTEYDGTGGADDNGFSRGQNGVQDLGGLNELGMGNMGMFRLQFEFSKEGN